MSERATAGGSKVKRPKQGNSAPANSAKPLLRAPQRLSTVQKLHLRLLEAGAGPSDRAGPSAAATAAAAAPADDAGGSSRDSSPGIDLVPPPQEPPAQQPPPPPPKKPAKRTAAQIFRELARCRAEQEEEIRRLSMLEFVPVTEEVVNKKAIELEENEAQGRAERRMLALLSLENSILSKDNVIEHKRKLGDETLQEKRKLRSQLAELRVQEKQIAERARRAVMALRERGRQSVSAAARRRATQARQFGEQTQAMVRTARWQREEERQQRAQLIQQIRQLEAEPLPRFKQLDLTETAGHGLLGEMSLVELRERLALLSMKRTAELHDKNKAILRNKQIQEEHMEVAEQVLRRFHQAQDLERQQRKQRLARRSPPVTSERLTHLQNQLQLKRAERFKRAALRRAQQQPQRHLMVTMAPPAAKVRSAPPGLGRTEPEVKEAVADGRRTKSDSCVRLGDPTRNVTIGALQSSGNAAR